MKSQVEELIALEERDDILFLLESEHGRRFLWKAISHCGVYQDIEMSENTGRLLGRRSVGLYLLTKLSEVSEDLVFKMMKEAKERDERIKLMFEKEAQQIKLASEGELDQAPKELDNFII